MLVARRQGGWGRWFAPIKGPWAGRWHAELARVAVFGLGLSALTALWMTAATFDLLPVDEANPAMPAAVSGQMGLSPAEMAALQDSASGRPARSDLSLRRRRGRMSSR